MKIEFASRPSASPVPVGLSALALALAASALLASCAEPAPAIPEGGPHVVLYAEFAQEVNSFSPVLTTERDFRALALRFGDEVALAAPAEKAQLAGFLEAVEKVGRGAIRAVPILQARSMSGGPLERGFYESIKARLVEAVRSAPRVDGVYLSLHGAMGVEGMLDPEGDLIEALVLTKEDKDGRLVLSKKRAQYERAWGDIEKKKEEDGVVSGPVIEVVKGGLIIDIGLRGFLPASLVELRRVRDLAP